MCPWESEPRAGQLLVVGSQGGGRGGGAAGMTGAWAGQGQQGAGGEALGRGTEGGLQLSAVTACPRPRSDRVPQ